MGLIIDTSVFIRAERGKFDLRAFLRNAPSQDAAMSAMTASALLQGYHRATPPHRAGRQAFVEGLLADFPIIPFDLPVARVHARLAAELAAVGRPVGLQDLQIAATAIHLGYAVLSFDARSFPVIPGLTWRSPPAP